MKSNKANGIGILNKAFANAMSKLSEEDPLVSLRRSFARAHGKELKAKRREGYAAERVIDLYVEAAKTLDGLTELSVAQYRAELIDVFNALEPGWLLAKPRRARSNVTAANAPKGGVAQTNREKEFKLENAESMAVETKPIGQDVSDTKR